MAILNTINGYRLKTQAYLLIQVLFVQQAYFESLLCKSRDMLEPLLL